MWSISTYELLVNGVDSSTAPRIYYLLLHHNHELLGNAYAQPNNVDASATIVFASRVYCSPQFDSLVYVWSSPALNLRPMENNPTLFNFFCLRESIEATPVKLFRITENWAHELFCCTISQSL